jgi:hypothetical protein
MDSHRRDHGLESLLAFDGHVHHLEGGYWLKFEIGRMQETRARPHGLSYGTRLIGFDNAHGLPRRTPYSRRRESHDHWHRGARDPGRPYDFTDAATLIDDFFDEVERVLKEKGIGTTVRWTEEING